MRRATHRGHCQVCGKLHKLPGGRLSIHGYTVAQGGYFTGQCWGEKQLPIQQDRSTADSSAAHLIARAEEIDLSIADDTFITRHTFRLRERDYSGVIRRVSLDAMAEVVEGRDGVKYIVGRMGVSRRLIDRASTYSVSDDAGLRRLAASALQHEAEGMRRTAQGILEFADRMHGTDLIPVETAEVVS